ncbi:hypothetical protein D9M72_339320 [compost metagenome]
MTRAWRALIGYLPTLLMSPTDMYPKKTETHDHAHYGCVDPPYRSIDRRLCRPIGARPVGLHQSLVSQRRSIAGNPEGNTVTHFDAGRGACGETCARRGFRTRTCRRGSRTAGRRRS